MESNVDFHIQDEAERLLKEIELVMKNVENSELYAGMCLDLKWNKTIQKHLFHLLDSHSLVPVIGNIEIYDPSMSSADIIVFKKLGLVVLTIDENCKRRTQRPTMFYMYNPYCYLIGNLLGANWSSSCLNQIFLLTNSFTYTLTNMPLCSSQTLETFPRLGRILDFTTEIDIRTGDNQMYANLFSDLPGISLMWIPTLTLTNRDVIGWICKGT
ncbi:hypothetical protein HAX54_012122 [Datura stramonium]|uniref:SRR1-like domain-containing protein n=1 Tax=Datura stramonium TaxID=4076 RepID=A0ABS8RK32_DATST|nr:hypothetical protein [Datura stramonium]